MHTIIYMRKVCMLRCHAFVVMLVLPNTIQNPVARLSLFLIVLHCIALLPFLSFVRFFAFFAFVCCCCCCYCCYCYFDVDVNVWCWCYRPCDRPCDHHCHIHSPLRMTNELSRDFGGMYNTSLLYYIIPFPTEQTWQVKLNQKVGFKSSQGYLASVSGFRTPYLYL